MAVTGGLRVRHPVVPPHCGVDQIEKALALEEVPELGPETSSPLFVCFASFVVPSDGRYQRATRPGLPVVDQFMRVALSLISPATLHPCTQFSIVARPDRPMVLSDAASASHQRGRERGRDGEGRRGRDTEGAGTRIAYLTPPTYLGNLGRSPQEIHP